jgi:hypothetical protein
MSKIKCECGHVIVDQTDNLNYKGYILPDSQVEKLSIVLTESIDSLIEAIKSGKRAEWIRENFGKEYPGDLNDSSMIHDLMTHQLVNTTQDIYECVNCRRILIQLGQTREFKIFSPDKKDDQSILS